MSLENRLERLEGVIQSHHGGMCYLVYDDGTQKEVTVRQAFNLISKGTEATGIIDVIAPPGVKAFAAMRGEHGFPKMDGGF